MAKIYGPISSDDWNNMRGYRESKEFLKQYNREDFKETIKKEQKIYDEYLKKYS